MTSVKLFRRRACSSHALGPEFIHWQQKKNDLWMIYLWLVCFFIKFSSKENKCTWKTKTSKVNGRYWNMFMKTMNILLIYKTQAARGVLRRTFKWYSTCYACVEIWIQLLVWNLFLKHPKVAIMSPGVWHSGWASHSKPEHQTIRPMASGSALPDKCMCLMFHLHWRITPIEMKKEGVWRTKEMVDGWIGKAIKTIK